MFSTVGVQYEQLNDMRVKFEGSVEQQDDLHAKYDLNLTADNLKVAALQAEEQAETIAEQFLTGILVHGDSPDVLSCCVRSYILT